jgi:hypothetical protein
MATQRNSTNLPSCVQAASAWRKGEAAYSSGDALCVMGLLEKWDFPMVTLPKNKKESPVSFTLGDMVALGMNSKGEEKRSVKSDMLAAVYREIYMREDNPKDVPNAIKAGHNRCYGAAMFLAHHGVQPTLTSDGHLAGVPLAYAMPAFDSKGQPTKIGKVLIEMIENDYAEQDKKPTAIEIANEIASTTIVCNGKTHRHYGKLPSSAQAVKALKRAAINEGLLPFKTREGSNEETEIDVSDMAKRLSSTLDVVRKATPMEDNDEVEYALSPEHRAVLAQLGEAIALYFIADPLEPLENA